MRPAPLRIFLFNDGKQWLARCIDPDVVRAFGSDTIPTAFTAAASADVVLAELRARNPDADVVLDLAVEVLLDLRRKVADAGCVLPLFEARTDLATREKLGLDQLALDLYPLLERACARIDKELAARGVNARRPT